MKHHRILSKKNIVCCLLLMFAVAYALCYRYALAHTQKPLIRYFDRTETVTYGGLEYTFSESKIYTKEQLIEQYQLDPTSIENFSVATMNRADLCYIITKIHVKRISEIITPPDYYILNSHYLHISEDPQVKELIRPKNYKEPERLEVGEETEWYEVMFILDKLYDQKIWNRIGQQTFYMELIDYADQPYLTWVRVFN